MGQVTAVRLRVAARALTRTMDEHSLDPRIRKMAATPAMDWTSEMVSAAVVVLNRWRRQLTAAGIDAATVLGDDDTTGNDAAKDPPEGAAAEAVPTGERFRYDGTVDGLRGIPLSELASVDASRAARLAEYGLHNIYDLLHHVPLRYLDRSTSEPINQLEVGEQGTVIGTVVSSTQDQLPKVRVAKINVRDHTGMISCTFFNMPWKAQLFRTGDEVVLSGRLDCYDSPSGGRYLQMTNPLLDRTGSNAAPIIPIYPQSAKTRVTTWEIHRAAMEAVERLGDLTDPIPSDVRGGPNLLDRAQAYRQLHRPQTPDEAPNGRRRLAYDELLHTQLALRMHRLAERQQPGVHHRPDWSLTTQLIENLPFTLTAAQKNALGQIADDLEATEPMHRLLQGDVGSGKTLVALLTLLMGVESNLQGALLAPTELLAVQHHAEVLSRINGLTRSDGKPVVVELLTGSLSAGRRSEILKQLASGVIDIVVGTHALLVDEVTFDKLGVIVVDEQHRFGVDQRAQLAARGPDGARADVLVMTATPIPRTAAMTVFGDLDVTVLDELPPGRTPIDTVWEEYTPDPTDRDDPVWSRVRRTVEAGRQAYIVCPLIDDSETKAAASAGSTASELETGALTGLRVGLVHGKLAAADRAHVMEQFGRGDLDVLVATTVIEVGVDVANAALMVILNPGQFGMAQLHQLRGRVGRGSHLSTCILAGGAGSAETRWRLEAIIDTTDGFQLSETDLAIRGTGALLGTRQHGLSDLKVAALETDTDLLMLARDDAAKLLDDDPKLSRHPALRAEVHAALGEEADGYLTAS